MMHRPADRKSRMQRWSAGALLPAILLAACGSGSETGPGGVSEGEAEALDEAAEELDKQQIPEGAVPPLDLPQPAQTPGDADAAQETPAEETDQSGS